MAYETVNTTAGGQNVRILVPDNYVNKCVVYHHGAGEDYTSINAADKASIVTQLTGEGYLMAASSAHGDNWGNQAAVDDYVALQSYLVTNYAPAKTALMSQSMGGLTGLLTASAGFAGLCGWFGIYPVCNLSAMFANNAGTYAGAIRSAYSIAADGSDYSTKTSGHDPVLLTASTFNRLPMRFWHSSGDTVVGKTANSDQMQTLVSGSKQESTVIATTGDHGDASNFNPTAVSDFLDRCFVDRSIGHRSV